jgi:phage I-like protein
MNTLAELSADLHRLAADQQRRTGQLEESLLALIKLTGSHDESIDELRAAQAESEHKIAALANTMINLAESQKQLAESQTHSDRRLDALIDIVRQWGNGRS